MNTYTKFLVGILQEYVVHCQSAFKSDQGHREEQKHSSKAGKEVLIGKNGISLTLNAYAKHPTKMSTMSATPMENTMN